jgi:REP element-mobilizing transposase RayT
MTDYYIPLVPDGTYHILSRAVGNEKLFLYDANYEFFLEKYKQHILPIADTFAFCLLPNHFHFLLQIKPLADLSEYFKQKKCKNSIDLDRLPDFIMQSFSNLLNSYAKSFNKVYQRKGALFMNSLRRVEIAKDCQFGSTIFYIHKNPVHHGYADSVSSWRWSSYNILIGNAETILKRTEVLHWFGHVSAFRKFHEQPIYLKPSLMLE